ncbi:MAG: amidohydrolase family protein [Planctomycetales bacterium]|nr:amidohydrolase family protein [Planctomycetales bacterium]
MARRGGRKSSWLPAACLGTLVFGVALPRPLALCAQVVVEDAPAKLDGSDGRPLAIENFEPRSMLRSAQSNVDRAKFPVVDVHVHARYKLRQTTEALDEAVRAMDAHNIAVCVSLDGGLGDELEKHLQFLGERYAQRFVVFANIDWRGDAPEDDPAAWDCQRPDFARRTAQALAAAQRAGAVGVKIFKRFGLDYRNPDGSFLAVDDPRWDPIWEACGRLNLPILIHTADPAAFFLPVDRYNERWEELSRHPDWSFADPAFPRREELLAARNRVIAKHPRTRFIGAHVANNPEDLAEVGKWLDAYPNLSVDIAARLAELGRQPRTARQFFLKYSDRILFGTDGPRPPSRLRPHWRLLETWDEYFPYAEDQYPPQGLWQVDGLGLPDDTLRQVYSTNAARLISGIAERLENYTVIAPRSP